MIFVYKSNFDDKWRSKQVPTLEELLRTTPSCLPATVKELPRLPNVLDGETLDANGEIQKPKLEDVQRERLISIKKLCEDRLSQHYSVFDLLSLSTTLTEASATGLTNRTKYLYPLKAWSAGAYDFFYAKQTEVLACKSVEEVQAVKDPDFSSWEALKPDVKFNEAMAIKD